MRVVYYTSGITGAGRLVTGIAIGNALARKGVTCRYSMVHTSPAARLADDFHNIKVPLETETELSEKNCRASVLYKTLKKLKPDVLLVNHTWFAPFHFIRELPCKKIYLSDQAYDSHFRVPLPGGDLVFDPGQYDRVLAIEPFTSGIAMERINPLVVRDRDEILDRAAALRRLRLDGSRKVALYSFSGDPGDYERHLEQYAYLDREYEVVRLSLGRDLIFPVVDCFNAVDLLICGAGYNQVWEANYFRKKAIFEIHEVRFSDQRLRVQASESFHFDENGADQLVDMIVGL